MSDDSYSREYVERHVEWVLHYTHGLEENEDTDRVIELPRNVIDSALMMGFRRPPWYREADKEKRKTAREGVETLR